MKKRILITGASGMLGACLAKEYSNKFEVYATGHTDFKENTCKNYLSFDFKEDSYIPLVEWAKPDVIVHCAALANGNYCNAHPEEAFNINGISIKKLLEATADKVKIIYISTDAVFPSKTHLASEKDHVSPENIYGKSKELGEFFLLNSTRDYTIVRTTIVGLNLNSLKKGFVEWIIESVKTNSEIQLFDDVIFTPISIWDLAKEIEVVITNKSRETILHISGSEICSKYDFGSALLTSLNLPLTYVRRGKITNFKDRAKRCTDQTLSSEKYKNIFNRSLPTIHDTLQIITKKYSGNE